MPPQVHLFVKCRKNRLTDERKQNSANLFEWASFQSSQWTRDKETNKAVVYISGLWEKQKFGFGTYFRWDMKNYGPSAVPYWHFLIKSKPDLRRTGTSPGGRTGKRLPYRWFVWLRRGDTYRTSRYRKAVTMPEHSGLSSVSISLKSVTELVALWYAHCGSSFSEVVVCGLTSRHPSFARWYEPMARLPVLL